MIYAAEMKTLVLCVDRDDDLGTKASIRGPIIGREENLDAARKLGLADPEDSDVNSILSAVALYDDLVKKGIESEIATITGDQKVGFQSDLVLTKQLENLLELVRPDRAILVSDGQEDEYIYPMVSSRVKIDSVKRVFVRQSESLEGFYYFLVKSLKDVKIRKKWILPLSLSLIIYGMLSLIYKLLVFRISPDENLHLIPSIGLSVILIVIGVYLIWWAFDLGRMRRKIAVLMRQGSLIIPFALVAVMLSIVGIFIGYDSVSAYASGLLPEERSAVVIITLFVQAAIWPFVFAALCYEGGKAITWFLQKGKIRWSYIIAIISILATGFIVQGVADAVDIFLRSPPLDPLLVMGEILTGVMVAIFGAVLYSSLREEMRVETGIASGTKAEADDR